MRTLGFDDVTSCDVAFSYIVKLVGCVDVTYGYVTSSYNVKFVETVTSLTVIMTSLLVTSFSVIILRL